MYINESAISYSTLKCDFFAFLIIASTADNQVDRYSMNEVLPQNLVRLYLTKGINAVIELL